MGNTTSYEQTEPDPWWGQSTSQQNNQNGSQQCVPEPEATVSRIYSQETTRPLHAMCYQREQALGQTIQHLAEENMRISSARRAAEKRSEEVEAETQHTNEELEKLRNEAEKAQQLFEKLHGQIQSGREDRQMITSEMERIRNGFDREREANDKVLSEMRHLRAERDESRRTVDILNGQLKEKALMMERAMTAFSQEKIEKDNLVKELESLRDELRNTKVNLTDASKYQEVVTEQKSSANQPEESAIARIRSPTAIAEMERFQAEMNTRREVRQRAMQNVTAEMERLKTELNAEREARQQVTKQLEETLQQLEKRGKSKQEEALTLQLEHSQQKIMSDKRRIKQIMQENNRLQYELDNARQALTERTDELEKLQSHADSEREQTQIQVEALKEVANICKEMLNIREGQVVELKEKLKEIEVSVINKVHERLPVDLKSEYEAQMENIRSLKNLYEERMKNMLTEKEKLVQDSEEKSHRLDEEIKKSAEIEQKLADMKLSLEEKEEENSNLQIKLDDSHDKSHGLAKELKLINNLFTQMLIGSSSTDMNLDRLTKLLQENHDLLTDITIKEDSSEIAAVLPKLILDLVNQIDNSNASDSSFPTDEKTEDKANQIDNCNASESSFPTDDKSEDKANQPDNSNASESSFHTDDKSEDKANQTDDSNASESSFSTDEKTEGKLFTNEEISKPQTIPSDIDNTTDEGSKSDAKNASEEFINGMAVHDIALNLPKVWKVLLELLSHHVAPCSSEDQEEKKISCYKSVDTPAGPRLVISVSQTFLHLKDLILEKKSLQKELGRLKHLNGHLERKLTDQEQKLSVVSTELRKTWNVVDQMQTQHQKLHTHEKILRYELHEKRLMLNELKQELEYCREKWERARQKNSESEVEWKKLRMEFASRKKQPDDLLNNSGDSGVLDEREDESCDDDDSPNKDTGQLDPGINLSSAVDIRTSSPLESSFPQTLKTLTMQNSTDVLNETQSELLFDLECESELDRENSENINSFIPRENNSEQDVLTDCRFELTNNNCSTISIITQLKQQLAFFSKNLQFVSSADNDYLNGQNLKALESIFSLPPIQIPKHITDSLAVPSCFESDSFDCDYYQNFIHNFSSYTIPSTSASCSSSCNDFSRCDSHKNTSKDSTDISLHVDNMNSVQSASNDGKSKTLEVPTAEVCKAESSKDTPRANRTPEEIAEARAARLKRLEEQCQQLYNKVSRTSHRSTALCNRLDELHGQMRGSESPPTSRNDLTESSENDIPSSHSSPISRENVTSCTTLPQASQSSSESERLRSNTIPLPPPLPRRLIARRIPTSTDETSGEYSIPLPPSLPHTLPQRRIPTSIETSQTVNVPLPPPLPRDLRGCRLPVCLEESDSSALSSASRIGQCTNETTRQSNDNLPRQDENVSPDLTKPDDEKH